MKTTKPIASLFISLLFLLWQSPLTAQGWQKNYPPIDTSIYSYFYGPLTIESTMDGGSIFFRKDFPKNDSINPRMRLTKIDQDGAVQWDKLYFETIPEFVHAMVYGMIENQDGTYIISGYTDYSNTFLVKLDAQGNVIWHQLHPVFGTLDRQSMHRTSDNGYLLSGRRLPGHDSIYLVKTDSLGILQAKNMYKLRDGFIKTLPTSDSTYNVFTVSGAGKHTNVLTFDSYGNFLDTFLSFNPSIYVSDALKTPDNGTLLIGTTSNGQNIKIVKIDSIGNTEWDKSYNQPGTNYWQRISMTLDGGYVMSTAYANSWVSRIDASGNLIWAREFPGTILNLSVSKDSSFVVTKYLGNAYQTNRRTAIQAIKISKDGVVYGNFLSGKLAKDTNLNCQLDPNELDLSNWLVEAKGDQQFYAYTDSLGNYEIPLDTGSYELSVVTPAPLWNSCLGTTTVQVNPKDTIITDFPQQPIIDCPYLTVDVSVPALVRCFDNTYTVSYCNYGTIASPNSTVGLNFHPHFDVISSTIPWSNQSNNTYTFPVGSLNINECGTFYVVVNPNCDSTILGQTLCVNAYITPDTICTQPSPIWDGSITDLSVSCGSDSLTFTIQNIGLGDMSAPQDYFVIEDNFVPKQGTFQLLSLEKFQLKFPANGSTYRLYAGQAPGYFPPAYHPTIAYEGCGVNLSGTFSTGFLTMFPENDIINTESVDCQEVVGSYDPNDKQAEPKGYGTEHYIEVGDDLEYHIRFQNTGTDTAYTVAIRDTLSQHLDVSTLLLGSASHHYNLDIINGNILKFTFNDIRLVDSFTNEPASNGFVKFKISQDTLLPLGTMIYNSAAIYFDFNEPVITNETYHEIGEDFIPIIITTDAQPLEFQQTTVKVQPNPFVDYANIILEQAPHGKKTFELYDALGKLIKSEAFTDDSNHRFYKKGLSTGIYFYKILNDNKPLATGKIIAGN